MIPIWQSPRPDDEPKNYVWGGLILSSTFALPRLSSARREATPDVLFRWCQGEPSVLPTISDRRTMTMRDGGRVTLEAGGDEDLFIYRVNEVGTYALRAKDGIIEFFPTPGADPMRVEHFLVNTVLGVLTGLRGCLCLHAAAVAEARGAIVIGGPSGAGKSTSAWRLVQAKGAALLSDDSTVLRRGDDGAWWAYPGARTVRLPREVVGDDFGARADAWDNRGKWEWFVPGAEGPTRVVELRLVGVARPPEAEIARVVPSVVRLQTGWAWLGARGRSAVWEQATDLASLLAAGVSSEGRELFRENCQ